MPKHIPLIGLVEIGVTVSAQEMDNGELRVRCMQSDGSGYIWTEQPEGVEPSWQNAHFHEGIRETYVVERGQMAFATRDHGQQICRIYSAGEVVTSVPRQYHNVYLFAGAAIHTVKHGTPVGNPDKGGADWYEADPAFDRWTKGLSEEDMFRLSK